MSGHTPGPWTSGKNARGGWGVWATPLMYGVLDDSAPGIDAKANATLIAAAPELLEALRGMLDLYSEHDDCRDGADPEHGPDGACRACSARSAIARAEGREVRP